MYTINRFVLQGSGKIVVGVWLWRISGSYSQEMMWLTLRWVLVFEVFIVGHHLNYTSPERCQNSPSWCSRWVLLLCIPSRRCCWRSPLSLRTQVHLQRFPTVSSSVFLFLQLVQSNLKQM